MARPTALSTSSVTTLLWKRPLRVKPDSVLSLAHHLFVSASVPLLLKIFHLGILLLCFSMEELISCISFEARLKNRFLQEAFFDSSLLS